MTSRPPRQQGSALLVLLCGLLLAFTAYLLASRHIAARAIAYRTFAQAFTLAEAKAALLARAATDANRPGSLPCPDLLTDSQGLANFPGDGKADNLIGNECPSYLGWLPWVTLDLPEPHDAGNSRLWYALAPGYRDDDAAPVLNAESGDTLKLDDRNDIVALLIAPGPALPAQQRNSKTHPSLSASDYLEGANGNGNGRQYVSTAPDILFNDTVLPITRQELMAATGKRIAGEVRQCLVAHRRSPANTKQRYPWPAPLADGDAQSRAGSHFGRIPDTQAGPGPQASLREMAALLHASDIPQEGPEAQKQGLKTLRETTGNLQRLLVQLFEAGKQSTVLADNLSKQVGKLDGNIVSALQNGQISSSEYSGIRDQSTNSLTALSALENWLNSTGFDFFPVEAARLVASLDVSPTQAIESGSLDKLHALTELLSQTTTRNTDLSQALGLGCEASTLAESAVRNALAHPADAAMAETARNGIADTRAAARELLRQIERNRINMPAADIKNRTEVLRTDLARNLSAEAVRSSLHEISASIDAIETGSKPVRSARQAALTALENATSHPENIASQNREILFESLQALSYAMANNDDNLSQSSFNEAASRYRKNQSSFLEHPTASSEESKNLRLDALSLGYWSDLILRNARQMMTQIGGEPNTGMGIDASANQAVSALQQSLDGSGGSLSTLDKLLANPGNAALKTAADRALAGSRDARSRLQARLDDLQAAFASATAERFPVLWYADRCNFLQDKTAWWSKNRWQSQIFYQISELGDEGPPLEINGIPHSQLMVVAAGPPLGRQRRPSSLVDDYLEAANADDSRNGLAGKPLTTFRRFSLSAAFNDQLAY